MVSTLCRPNQEPFFLAGSHNCQPLGGGGQFAGAFQPGGGVQPGGGAGQLGGGLYCGIACHVVLLAFVRPEIYPSAWWRASGLSCFLVG